MRGEGETRRLGDFESYEKYRFRSPPGRASGEFLWFKQNFTGFEMLK
jgi:hypothetical protein